jgi:hypothetical protein
VQRLAGTPDCVLSDQELRSKHARGSRAAAAAKINVPAHATSVRK